MLVKIKGRGDRALSFRKDTLICSEDLSLLPSLAGIYADRLFDLLCQASSPQTDQHVKQHSRTGSQPRASSSYLPTLLYSSKCCYLHPRRRHRIQRMVTTNMGRGMNAPVVSLMSPFDHSVLNVSKYRSPKHPRGQHSSAPICKAS